jgi:hypothetical protein
MVLPYSDRKIVLSDLTIMIFQIWDEFCSSRGILVDKTSNLTTITLHPLQLKQLNLTFERLQITL